MASRNITALELHGAPYPPANVVLGEVPTPSVDDPISAIIIVLYAFGAAFNMTIFQRNKRRQHKFFMSAMLCGFSIARIVANSLRMAWASHHDNVNVIIAANVFVNAGVVVIFAINIVFAQRITRAYHPNVGWSMTGRIFFRFLLVSIVAIIIMVIVVLVYAYFTLDMNTLLKIRTVQRVGVTYVAFLAFAPIPIISLCLLFPRSGPVDKFGTGRMRTKVRLVLAASALLAVGAGFRAAVLFLPSRPINNPAWYHMKPCFYCFNYCIELIVLYTYAFIRVDRRFYVSDDSSATGRYTHRTTPGGSDTDQTAMGGDEEAAREKEEEEAEERNIFE